MKKVAEGFEKRLRQLAIELLLADEGKHPPHVRDVSLLAAELLAAGSDHPSTAAVAALYPTDSYWEARPLIADMLTEHGFLTDSTNNSVYALRLCLFGHGQMSLAELSWAFFERLPEWGSQSPLDQELVLLFDDHDHETDVPAKRLVEEQMRAAVRAAGF